MTEIEAFDDDFAGFDAEVASIEASLEFAEESLVADAQSLLQRAMDERQLSKADVARILDISRARVTQMLSPDCPNMTLRMLGRAAYKLDIPIMLVRADEVRAKKHVNGEWCIGNPLDASPWHTGSTSKTHDSRQPERTVDMKRTADLLRSAVLRPEAA